MLPIISYAIYNLSKWCFFSMLPVLITQKFSAGGPLVTSLVFKVLPRVLFAPLIAKVMLKKGAKDIAAIAILCYAPIYIMLLYIDSPTLFQAFVLLSGILDAVITTAMLVLRSHIAATGKNITVNAVFSTIESGSKIIGPALAGIILWQSSLLHSSYMMALSSILAAVLLFKCSIYPPKSSLASPISYQSFLDLFRNTPALRALFVPGLGYALLLGSLSPFLYWANIEIFHKPQEKWTLLLTFHSVGAVLGGMIAPKTLNFIKKRVSLITVYPWLVLARTLSFLPLIALHRWESALIVLSLAGLPEMLEVICFFTLLQRYLPAHREELFYAFSMPIFYVFTGLGTLLGGVYTQHLVGLRAFWLLISTLCFTLVMPFLVRIKTIKKP